MEARRYGLSKHFKKPAVDSMVAVAIRIRLRAADRVNGRPLGFSGSPAQEAGDRPPEGRCGNVQANRLTERVLVRSDYERGVPRTALDLHELGSQESR